VGGGNPGRGQVGKIGMACAREGVLVSECSRGLDSPVARGHVFEESTRELD